MRKIVLGISSCLLGNKVRYDGGDKRDPFLASTLSPYVDWVPVCPETECGLPVPREAMHLVCGPDRPRLVAISTGTDHTARMERWANRRLTELAGLGLSGFVFKSRSPSSGLRGVKVFRPDGTSQATGAGIFAAAFTARFPTLPVEDEERLYDPALRQNFIERVFVQQRWQEFANDGSLGGLVSFHSDHKYQIMAHSQRCYRELGTLVASGRKLRSDRLLAEYRALLMEGLKLLATPKKNANVLQHLAGYFKEQLAADDKQELQELITRYREGVLPLIVPVTVINHHARKYREPYLLRQHYLKPHPLELMLRNHA